MKKPHRHEREPFAPHETSTGKTPDLSCSIDPESEPATSVSAESLRRVAALQPINISCSFLPAGNRRGRSRHGKKNGGRARTVVTRSGKKFRGKFPSEKVGRMIHWESILERDAILMLEYHPLVLWYQEQPSEETYYDELGTPRRFYPDFLYETVSGIQVFVEVKYEDELRPGSKTQRKLNQIANSLKREGKLYRILTEKEIRRQPLHDNLYRLHDARQATPDDAAAAGPLAQIDHRAEAHTLASLAIDLGSETVVLGRLARGQLRADLEAPLLASSKIWMPGVVEANDGSFSI